MIRTYVLKEHSICCVQMTEDIGYQKIPRSDHSCFQAQHCIALANAWATESLG